VWVGKLPQSFDHTPETQVLASGHLVLMYFFMIFAFLSSFFLLGAEWIFQLSFKYEQITLNRKKNQKAIITS